MARWLARLKKMTDVVFTLPKPKVEGIGHILYRCADCGNLMDPEGAVIVRDRAYHPEHAPEEPNGR